MCNQHTAWQLLQTLQDKLLPHQRLRWVATTLFLALYVLRVVWIGGFYVVSYCLAVFVLSQGLHFLTPLQADLEDEQADQPVLPIRSADEFRPFLRKLSEFLFWRNVCLALLSAGLLTFVEALDIPVFWPVLLMYFLVLFLSTMRRQLSHMAKHGYLPFDLGKKHYSGAVLKA